MSLSLLKQADERTKCIIFGYSRESSICLSLNIPVMMQYLFMSYYWIQEKFVCDGKELSITGNQEIRGLQSTYTLRYNTVYGDNKVIDLRDKSIKRYQWSFKICNLMDIHHLWDFPICIGVDSSGCKHGNNDFSNREFNKSKFFGFGSDSYFYQRYFQPHHIIKGHKWKKGDMIHFILTVDGDKLITGLQVGNADIVRYKHDFDSSCVDNWNLAISIPTSNENVIQLLQFKALQQ